MTQGSSTRCLIVGAGGSCGATGNHAARQLLARGCAFGRSFARPMRGPTSSGGSAPKSPSAIFAITKSRVRRWMTCSVPTSPTRWPMAFSRQRRPSLRRLHSSHVLTVAAQLASRVVAFQDIGAVRRFDLPASRS